MDRNFLNSQLMSLVDAHWFFLVTYASLIPKGEGSADFREGRWREGGLIETSETINFYDNKQKTGSIACRLFVEGFPGDSLTDVFYKFPIPHPAVQTGSQANYAQG